MSIAAGSEPAGGDRPEAGGRRRRARRRARAVRGGCRPAPRRPRAPRRGGGESADGARGGRRRSPSHRPRWLTPRRDRPCDLLTEARELTDRILDQWAERLRGEVAGRDGDALGLRSRHSRQASPRGTPPRLVPRGGRHDPRPWPAWRRRWRRSTPTRWCTTISRAWTTTTSGAGARRRTGGSTCRPPRAPASCWCRSPPGSSRRPPRSWASRPRRSGRMAVELFRAGGIEGMVGGQWLDLEAEGRALALDELIAVHRGKTGALIRAACTLGAIAAEAAPAEVAALDRLRRGDRPRLPDGRRRARRHRHQRGAGEDGRSRRPARQVHLRQRVGGGGGPGGGRAAGPARGRPPRRGGRAERGVGGAGGVYCNAELLTVTLSLAKGTMPTWAPSPFRVTPLIHSHRAP